MENQKEKLTEIFDSYSVYESYTFNDEDILNLMDQSYSLAQSESADRIKELEAALKSLRHHPRIDPILQSIIADKLTPYPNL